MVVVNGPGGLDDANLEARVRMVRLPRNLGPAGGFGAGMEVAFADPSVHWAYLCEDDVGLFVLPSPRLSDVMGRMDAHARLPGRPVGAVVAYGRRFVGRGSHTINVVPPEGSAHELIPVDVAVRSTLPAPSHSSTVLARAAVPAQVPIRVLFDPDVTAVPERYPMKALFVPPASVSPDS